MLFTPIFSQLKAKKRRNILHYSEVPRMLKDLSLHESWLYNCEKVAPPYKYWQEHNLGIYWGKKISGTTIQTNRSSIGSSQQYRKYREHRKSAQLFGVT